MGGGFDDFGLEPHLCQALKEAFDITLPTPIQRATIPKLLECSPQLAGLAKADSRVQDVLIRAETGSGKTLAFLLPILHQLFALRGSNSSAFDRHSGTFCIILEPTRELAAQMEDLLLKLIAKLRGKHHWIVSGSLSGGDRRKSEKQKLRKGLHIVIGTPGRLLDHLENTQVWAENIRRSCRWVVMDESDRLMDMGFEKKIGEILGKVLGPASESRDRSKQVILCSATLKSDTRSFVGYALHSPVFAEASLKRPRKTIDQVDFTAPERLEQRFVDPPTKMRLFTLVGLLQKKFVEETTQIKKIVVFLLCCDEVDFLFTLFATPDVQKLGWNSDSLGLYKLHGNMEHQERIATFNSFISKQDGRSLLLCTDVAARGLNLNQVSCIVQYDAPCDINDYIHRAGRTARLGEIGQSILFLMPSEKEYRVSLAEKGVTLKLLKWEDCYAGLLGGKLNSKIRFEEDESNTGGFQSKLEALVKSDRTFTELAKRAYLSTVRAYATHPASEKSIFHIKRLHLGHLAATFGLAEAPKTLGLFNKSEAGNTPRKDGVWQKRNDSQRTSSVRDTEDRKRKPDAGPVTPEEAQRRMAALAQRKGVSEFAAGNIDDLSRLSQSSKRYKK